jgi:hypothetical protein
MIKDIVVNLSVGERTSPAGDYAVSIAATFDAHVAGIAFVYDPIVPGSGAGYIPGEVFETQQRDNAAATKAALERGFRSLRATKSNMPNPIRICFWLLRNGWGLGSRHRRSSATACGICWLLGEPARSASVFCQAATARKSWSAPAPIESTQIRPTF